MLDGGENKEKSEAGRGKELLGMEKWVVLLEMVAQKVLA
jgi:hypothetical protein